MSISISLPDGSVREFNSPITGFELASDIGLGLAKAAIAIEVNGRLLDISRVIESDCEVKIITRKDEQALELIRHDAAHVMAQAVQELYPGTK